MADWLFWLPPLLVLPIVGLFRFIGCKPFDPAPAPGPPPPRYRDYLMGDPRDVLIQTNPNVRPNANNIIGYWRLIDSGPTAIDEGKQGRHGSFKSGEPILSHEPTAGEPGTEAAPGTFMSGKASLIASDKLATCRSFNGGYVVVPYAAGLYTDQFTIEAWIEPQFTLAKPGYEHTLFSASGHFPAEGDVLADSHGFELFAEGVADGDRWQVRFPPQTGAVFIGIVPRVPTPGPSHVALTVEKAGTKRLVRLFVQGKEAASATIDRFSLPNGAFLFIGAANNAPERPTSPVLRSPVLSKVQEVVLHRTALSPAEIENHATFKTE